MNPAEDILTYLEQKGHGKRSLQSRERMTMTNSEMYIIAENTTSPTEPYYLDGEDTVRVTITMVMGQGEKGYKQGAIKSYNIYRELFLKHDVAIKETLYRLIRALGAPTESTFGTTVQFSFTIELVRELV